MNKWEIMQYTGIGPLRFGFSRSSVRAELGDDFSEFRKSVDSINSTDEYSRLGMHLYYDSNNKLEFIECFSPCPIHYRGVSLLGKEFEVVLKELEDLGLSARHDDYVCYFDDVGFALYVSGEVVDGASVYRKGYYDEAR